MSEADSSSKKRLSELRVVDLRHELERRGLDRNGVKTALVERLTKALEDEGENPEEYLFEVMNENVKTPAKVTPAKRSSRKSKEGGGGDNADDEEDEKQGEQTDKKEISKEGNEKDENHDETHVSENKDSENDSKINNLTDSEKVQSTKAELVPIIVPLKAEEVAKAVKKSKTSVQESVEESHSSEESPTKNTVVSTKNSEDSTPKTEEVKVEDVQEERKTQDSSADSEKTSAENTNKETKSTENTVSDSKNLTSPTTAVQESSAAPSSDKSSSDKTTKTEVKKDGSKVKVAESVKNLWVSGLSDKTKATDLKSLFSKHGKVLGAKIVTNSKTPYKHFYGFVMMASSSDASACVEHLHHTELHGRLLTVEKTTLEPGSSLKKAEDLHGEAAKKAKETSADEKKEDAEKADTEDKTEVSADQSKEGKTEKEEGIQEESKTEEVSASVTSGDKEAEGDGTAQKATDTVEAKSDDKKEKKGAEPNKKRDSSEERRRRRRSLERRDKDRSRHHSKERHSKEARPGRSRSREKHRRSPPSRSQRYGRSHHGMMHGSRGGGRRPDDRNQFRYGRRPSPPYRRPSSSKFEQEQERLRKAQEQLAIERLKIEREKQRIEREKLEIERAELKKRAHLVELDDPLKRPFDTHESKEYWPDRKRMRFDSPGRSDDFGQDVGYSDRRRYDSRRKGDRPPGRREGRPYSEDSAFSRGNQSMESRSRQMRDEWKGGKPSQDRRFEPRSGGSRNSFDGSGERGRNFDRPDTWNPEHDVSKFGPPQGPPLTEQWGPLKQEKWEEPPQSNWGPMEHPRGPMPGPVMPHPNQQMFSGPGNGMGNRMPGNFPPNRFGMNNNMRRF